MKILVTGRGKGGSWWIRGEQVGKAIGATIAPILYPSDPQKFDLAIVVKRPRPETIALFQRHNVRFVWDIVDSWPQPIGNEWNRSQCMAWLESEVKALKPVGLVTATECMANDCKSLGLPTLFLPHHFQPDLTVNPIREKVRKVGYDGGPQYLGRWQAFVTVECEKRGWSFLVNQPPGRPLDILSQLDIVVALRVQPGYAAHNWKSSVKLANAQGTGTPVICNRDAGYLEARSGGEVFADTEAELIAGLDKLADVNVRRECAAKLLAAAPSLDKIAEKYKNWLMSF